jgi:hypothetical protein
MSRSFLDRATQALREQAVADDEAAEQTLARVLTTVRRRGRRRRIFGVIGLQVGLATFGVAAWAAASGRLETFLARVLPARVEPQPLDVRPPQPRVRRRPAPVALPADEPPLPAPPAERPRPARAPAATRAIIEPPPPDEQALYRQAHEIHFVRREFAAAVAAWDRYLALPRPGQLAVEARYNRAIALYRLGRRADAVAALLPFARGDYGPYRQPEARALLEQLGNPSR